MICWQQSYSDQKNALAALRITWVFWQPSDFFGDPPGDPGMSMKWFQKLVESGTYADRWDSRNDVAVVENKWLCMLLAKVESSDTTSKKQKQKTTQNKNKEQHKKQHLKNLFFCENPFLERAAANNKNDNNKNTNNNNNNNNK